MSLHSIRHLRHRRGWQTSSGCSSVDALSSHASHRTWSRTRWRRRQRLLRRPRNKGGMSFLSTEGVSPGPSSASPSESSQGARERTIIAKDDVDDLLTDTTFLNEVSRSQDAREALSVMSSALAAKGLVAQEVELTADHMHQLLTGCLERNAVELCLSIFRQMTSTPRLSASQDDYLEWPSISVDMICLLVLALAKRLRVNDALTVMQILAFNVTSSDAQEIVFGKVISSPMPPYNPLAVVQPQEGIKTVACSASRYLFEIFSGEVTSIRSEATEASNDVLVSVARFLRLWRKPKIRAIHEVIVTTPGGIPRSFRFGTEFSEVPAKESDRVSIVCAPAAAEERNYIFFAPIPPSARPGEALSLTNHTTSLTVPLIRAPGKNSVDTVPSWILPAAILLAGSDAASSMLDPNLPWIGAASIAAIGASMAISNSAVLPRLKQLPTNRLGAEPLRQELLGRHQILISKIEAMMQEASNDVRSLAKLWQLESKMTSVDATGKYEARIQRIDKARRSLENRLTGRMELMQGYRRVANMIEIEVEMDVDVPAAEVEGIEEQLTKLEEVESLQAEMEYQAEAQDEVERLLRTTDGSILS